MDKIKTSKITKLKTKKKAKDMKDYEAMLLEMINENIKKL